MEECQAMPSSWSSLKDHSIVDEPPKITASDDEAFRLQQHNETDFCLNGFRKIAMPFLDGDHHINNSNTKLCRPCYQRSFSDPSAGLKTSSQCHSKMFPNGWTCPHSSALPPQHPRLGRSFSSPNSMPHMVKNASQSSSCIGMVVDPSREDSTPEFKRMKRMNDCVKEIKNLCNELSQQVEDEVTSQESSTEPTITKDLAALPLVEESVSVEKTGECLAIHFTCPCSKGYQILLSGKNCYYKLM